MTAESSLEARVAHVEGILDEVRSRFSSLEGRMDRLESTLNSRMDRLEDRMTALEGKLQSNFQWMIGLMLPMWMTIILAVVLQG